MILTKASKLALYALTEMALHPGEFVSASVIAARFEVSENHIAKVLQQLQRSGLVESVRGAGGGYQLARPANAVTMADVVRSIEGPLSSDGCADCPLHDELETCSIRPTCNVHQLLSELSTHVYYTLESVTIATLARAKSTDRIRPRTRKESA